MRPETPSGAALAGAIVIACGGDRVGGDPLARLEPGEDLHGVAGLAAEPDLPQLRAAAGVDDVDRGELGPAHERAPPAR